MKTNFGNDNLNWNVLIRGIKRFSTDVRAKMELDTLGETNYALLLQINESNVKNYLAERKCDSASILGFLSWSPNVRFKTKPCKGFMF